LKSPKNTIIGRQSIDIIDLRRNLREMKQIPGPGAYK